MSGWAVEGVYISALGRRGGLPKRLDGTGEESRNAKNKDQQAGAGGWPNPPLAWCLLLRLSLGLVFSLTQSNGQFNIVQFMLVRQT